MDFSHDTCKMVIFHESFEENPLIKKFFNHRDYIVECKLERSVMTVVFGVV